MTGVAFDGYDCVHDHDYDHEERERGRATCVEVEDSLRWFVDVVVTRYVTYSLSVILSFRDKRTRDFADGKRVKAFDGIRRAAEMKLDQVDAATSIRDLALPGNRLEALKGVRKGQHSIRINDQWRLCFEWRQGAPGPTEVEIVDYH